MLANCIVVVVAVVVHLKIIMMMRIACVDSVDSRCSCWMCLVGCKWICFSCSLGVSIIAVVVQAVAVGLSVADCGCSPSVVAADG